MYNIVNLCQQIFQDMWSRKLRSILALFGIVWGTAAVILLISFGRSFIQANQAKVTGLADGSLFITAGHSSEAFRGYPIDRPVSLKADDIMQLPKYVPHIQRISVDFQHTTSVRSGEQQNQVTVQAAGRDYFALRKVKMIAGSRIFTPQELSNAEDVAVIGKNIKKIFFGNRPAIGQYLEISYSKYRIIGVMKSSSTAGENFDNMAIIPYKTYINVWGNKDISYFIIQPQSGYGAEVKQSLRDYLGIRYHFRPDDQIALSIQDTTAFANFFRWFFMIIQMFLGLCGAMTLGVGGLGVANIMFLIVTERTKEIGLRMAIGARDWHIMLQIILESTLIVGVGGLCGFLLSLLIISLLQLIQLPPWIGTPTMSWIAVMATIIVLALLAILSGYFPAKRAASMDPVEALRL